jgi:ankyrin repeat protein
MVRNMRETLADATKAGDVASMSRIIRRGGAQIDALTTVRGYDVPISPLMLAVMQGNAQCMDLLIGAGADVNQRCGCHDETALHVCCAQGKAELARLLINAGADLGPADALGRSPLLMSCLCDAPACAELMIGFSHPGTFSAPSFAVQTSRCRHAKLPRATLASSCASPHPSPDLSLSLFRRLL